MVGSIYMQKQTYSFVLSLFTLYTGYFDDSCARLYMLRRRDVGA